MTEMYFYFLFMFMFIFMCCRTIRVIFFGSAFYVSSNVLIRSLSARSQLEKFLYSKDQDSLQIEHAQKNTNHYGDMPIRV